MSAAQRLILLALVLLAVFPARWLARELEPPPQAEELLPDDTLLFIHWNDFSRFASGVADNPLSRQLARDDFPEILRKLGMSEATLERFGGRVALARSLAELPLMPLLLRSRGMLALLPNRTPDLDLPASLGANLVFILPDGAARALALEGREAVEPYQGEEIFRIRIAGGRPLYACSVRGFTLCAFALEPLRRCIDQAVLHTVGGGAALADKLRPAGRRLQPERPGEFFAWADLRALQTQPRWGEALAPLWPGVRPRQAHLSHSFDGRISALNAALRFAPEELAAWLAGHGLAAPDQPPLAASLDKATLLHLWSNWFTPEVMAGLARAVESSDLARPLLAGISAFLGGMSLDAGDFHKTFDPELGLAVRGERDAGGQMRPLFALYFRPLDAPAMRTRLKRLVRPFPVRAHRLAHGAEATTIGMADGMVQPAFAFVGGRLVLADNLHMAQQVENQLQAGGERLLGVVDSPGEPVSASCFLFLRNRQVADAGEIFLKFLADARDERGAAILGETQRLFVRELALPCMAAMASAESSRLALAASGDEARIGWEFRLGPRRSRPGRVEKKDARPAAPVRALEKTKKKPAGNAGR